MDPDLPLLVPLESDSAEVVEAVVCKTVAAVRRIAAHEIIPVDDAAARRERDGRRRRAHA